MFTLSGKGDGWKGVILGILICLLAAGLYYRSKLPPLSQVNSAGAAVDIAARAKTPATIGSRMAAGRDARTWRTYYGTKETREFRLSRIGGVSVMTIAGKNRRTVVSGIFQSSESDVHAALMGSDDYGRCLKGYPPLHVQAYIDAGKPFRTVVEPGINWIAFFQTPPQPDLASAKSMAGLLVLSLQGLVGAPPASISLEIKTENEIFGGPADVERVRCDLVHQPGEAGRSWARAHPEWCGSD